MLQHTSQKKQLQKRLNFEKDIHVIPNDDWIEHVSDVNCECNPKIDIECEREVKNGMSNRHVFVHNQIKYNKELLN